MSSEDTSRSKAGDAGESVYADAARRWSELLNGWWREQAAGLPPELERVMSASLDQSRALVQVVCEQAGRALDPAPGGEAAPPGPAAGLWQPVIDACRACEANVLGHSSGASAAAGEYQRALRAYLNEFAELDREVAERVHRKIQEADPVMDFRTLHALVVEEAEQAYLERVSAERFAARQARFINALFRLGLEMRRQGEVSGDA